MKTLILLIIFVAIWLLVALIVRSICLRFKIDPEKTRWAKYLMIAVAAFVAGILTPLAQDQLTKLFG